MTPEEREQYNARLRAEHDNVLGPVTPEEIASAVPATVDPLEIDRILHPNGEVAAAQDLKETHDKLFGTVGSQQPPPVIGHVGPAARPSSGAAQVPTGASPRDGAAADKASNDSNQGRWTRDTAKALDLSDAMRLGEYSQEPDDVSALSGVASASSDYMRRVAEILRSMQAMIIENTLHIEELQSRFHRMR